jgi:hypothetical protein
MDIDTAYRSYDPDQAHRFWQALVRIAGVFEQFRAGFVGKSSPVHLFWGALDLATTRFSGRPAPPHPGGAPHCGPHVMLEAYSHEVSSLGYWPGGAAEGIFYSYAYPNPAVTGAPRSGHRQLPGMTIWSSLSSRTSTSAPPTIPTRCCSSSPKPHTKPPPTPPAGTGRVSNETHLDVGTRDRDFHTYLQGAERATCGAVGSGYLIDECIQAPALAAHHIPGPLSLYRSRGPYSTSSTGRDCQAPGHGSSVSAFVQVIGVSP